MQQKLDPKPQSISESDMRLFAPLPQAVKLGSFSFARVTGPGETFAVRTAVDSLIEFANFSSDIFSDSRVYSNWEPQHIIGKEGRLRCTSCVWWGTSLNLQV